MIRVGFIPHVRGNEWLGGINYFRSLLTALAGVPGRRIAPVLFIAASADPGLFEGMEGVEVRRTRLLDRLSPPWGLRKGIAVLTRRDRVMEWMLRRAGVGLLSHSAPAGSLPLIGWIPDLQHRHLPEFFSPEDRRQRDVYFERLVRNARRVILSSEAARRDLLELHPAARDKAVVLHFVPQLDRGEPRPSLAELERKHRFAGPYLYLPNQFWAHKNHAVVVEALALLATRGVRPLVLATGATEDSRNTSHCRALLERARSAGLEDGFRVLGIVPYPEVVALLTHAHAVINPSLFEGWSTTVEEAKALGRRTVLSDIATHREQDPPGALFFDPRRPEELARILTELWQARDAPLPPDPETEERHRHASRAFGERFHDLVLEVAREAGVAPPDR